MFERSGGARGLWTSAGIGGIVVTAEGATGVSSSGPSCNHVDVLNFMEGFELLGDGVADGAGATDEDDSAGWGGADPVGGRVGGCRGGPQDRALT